MQGNVTTHPDDMNQLIHVKDRSYSLGLNDDSSTEENKDMVEQGPTQSQTVTEKHVPLVECHDVQAIEEIKIQ